MSILCFVLMPLNFLFLLLLFKGTVQRDFGPQFFFHNSNQHGSLTNRLKYFRFWLRFRRDIRILVSKKMTPLSVILRGAFTKKL